MNLRTLNGQSFTNQRVLIRTDYNVPLQNGKVQDGTRIRESLPTLQFLLDQGARLIVMSHLGRPKGSVNLELRMNPVAEELSRQLGKPVRKLEDCIGPSVQAAVMEMKAGEVLMLENLRFHPEEEANDPGFAQALASLADSYVSDAFGTVHRAHASTVGVAQLLPAFAGFLVEKEVRVLAKLLEAPEHPVCLIAGGAKVDTKIGILEKFLPIADTFILGGALANTFLKAQGHEIGESLYEPEKLTVAQQFLAAAAQKRVLLPVDAVCATEVKADAPAQNLELASVHDSLKILDIGAQTIQRYVEAIQSAQTIIWNGPMGLYEMDAFSKGTQALADAIAQAPAYSVLGGGDTIDAIHHFGFSEKDFTHLSTGGGAMLEFLEGKGLPGLDVLCA